MTTRRSPRIQFLIALGLSTLVSIGLFAYGAWRNNSWSYNYLIWNLFLAWLPLAFALWLTQVLRAKLWSSWEGLAATGLWLVFLPNSFYMISDFIHLQELSRVDILFDTLMFTSFIFTGVVLGFSSLYLVHLQIRRRFSQMVTMNLIAATIFVCSVAIYVGRDLRWNSWDVLTNPGGLLFDLSERIQDPGAYPQMLRVIIVFFVLLSSMYFLVLQTIRVARSLEPAQK